MDTETAAGSMLGNGLLAPWPPNDISFPAPPKLPSEPNPLVGGGRLLMFSVALSPSNASEMPIPPGLAMGGGPARDDMAGDKLDMLLSGGRA